MDWEAYYIEQPVVFNLQTALTCIMLFAPGSIPVDDKKQMVKFWIHK